MPEPELGLAEPEWAALMALYLHGRRLGLANRVGPLGKLVQLHPRGHALMALGDAVQAAERGRLREAATYIRAIPASGAGAVSKRNKAVATLEAFAALSPGRP